MGEKEARIHQLMENLGLDGMLVTSFENRRYLTGFSGSSGVAYVTRNQTSLWTDQRYEIQSQQQAPQCQIDIARGPIKEFYMKNIQQIAQGKVGFESESLSVAEFAYFKESAPNIQWVPLGNELLQLRALKSTEEITLLRQSIRKADQAFSRLLPFIKEGVTEKELKVELEYLMAKEGHEGAAFGTIVAFGERAALPHAVPTARKLKPGEMALIDFGINFEGYMSDMTRTLKFGKISEEEEKIFNLTLKALESAIEEVGPGVDVGYLDEVHRSIFRTAGVEGQSLRGLGHGVGLQIHEYPRVVEKGQGTLEESMVFTVEPGLYFPDKYGVRIEDVVLVTSNGHEVLTETPREIHIG